MDCQVRQEQEKRRLEEEQQCPVPPQQQASTEPPQPAAPAPQQPASYLLPQPAAQPTLQTTTYMPTVPGPGLPYPPLSSSQALAPASGPTVVPVQPGLQAELKELDVEQQHQADKTQADRTQAISVLPEAKAPQPAVSYTSLPNQQPQIQPQVSYPSSQTDQSTQQVVPSPAPPVAPSTQSTPGTPQQVNSHAHTFTRLRSLCYFSPFPFIVCCILLECISFGHICAENYEVNLSRTPD